MFTIITPTYKRSDDVMRAITSVCNQTRDDYTLIVVNDSPDDVTYEKVKAFCDNNPRITYVVNETNIGVNASRNRGLALAPKDSWIIFLDDDDYLAPDALLTFSHLIEKHPAHHWFMTKRVLATGESITQAPISNTLYSYAWDYLITKKITGDATHCIHKKSIEGISFSQHIKQGEEWIFFYSLGLRETIFYSNHASTISNGYGVLNFRTRSKKELFSAWKILMGEGRERGFLFQPSFLVYMSARLLLLILR